MCVGRAAINPFFTRSKYLSYGTQMESSEARGHSLQCLNGLLHIQHGTREFHAVDIQGMSDSHLIKRSCKLLGETGVVLVGYIVP